MRRLMCLGAALGIMLASSIAQAGWSRTYGTDSIEEGLSVVHTADGGYIVAGYSEPLAGMLILKTDSLGDTLWSLEPELDWQSGKATSVIETTDGHYVVAGYAAPVWDGRYHLVVLKIDTVGEVIWCKGDLTWYESAPGSVGYSIAQTADGGYVVTGAFSHAFDEIDDLLLIKLDAEGDTMWTRSYGAEEEDCGHCVCQTSDGGYIVSGYSEQNMWLLETDEHGDTIWTFALEDWPGKGYSIAETSDSCFVVTGYVAPYRDGKYHFYLLKLDSNGDTLWSRMDGESVAWPGGVGRFLQETPDGAYIITGYTSEWDDERTDLFLIKIDGEGDTVWTRIYGGEDADAGYSVDQTSDGGYVVAGATQSFGAGGYDLWLLKTDSLGDTLTGIQESGIDLASNWHVLSPVGREIMLRYGDYPHGFHASVFDASGRKVDELHATGPSGTVTWPVTPVTHHSPGVYFIRSGSDDLIVTRKIVLIP